MNVLHIHYQHYHITPVFTKQKKVKEDTELNLQTIFNEDKLDNLMDKQFKNKSLPVIEIWDQMTVKELANSAKRDINDVLNVLYFINKNDKYEENTILTTMPLLINVVKYLGGKHKFISKKIKKTMENKDITKRPLPNESQLIKRHPIVTIMGHVDHGKTTLLDALRNTSIAKSEFGGITQCIGAFDVTLESGERVTFLDTPGHAAFISMRHRGAHITDIVVLVVAADDGVKEQTLQSIEMAKDAKVPIIVAINKIDKPNIDIIKVQYELAKHGIVIEELGGEIQCVKISALKGINLRELTEAIIVQAELMDLKGDLEGLVEGVIIDCSNHIGRGKLVTALIQRGTLKKGCLLVSGIASAKVRSMFNDSGNPILKAKPSEVVQILGWKELPNVGDEILEVENDKILQEVIKFRQKQRAEILAKEHKAAADQKLEKHLIEYKKMLKIKRLFGKDRKIMDMVREKIIEEKRKNKNKNLTPAVNIIVKGDVAGSVEALLDIFDTYTYDTICQLNIVHYGIGFITQSDIELANTFKAIIYGFNVNATKQIKDEANKKGVSLRFYNVVYKLIDNIKKEIYDILPEVDVEEILGEAKVLQNFDIKDKNKKVNVAGCRCVKGILLKSGLYHVLRGNENIYSGKLISMRHLKEEVSSIETNYECGLRFEDPMISFQPGDTIICINIKRQKEKIEWDPGF
ncbi:translation initiation factor 2 [Apis mellifera]|uniref:Translation initiation factor 2 n=1 Tax=Apis mellifera TaxID=7460 RepID=A0A8U0WQ80_APIME|nr:translation initiation factor 2 [Apis mellifera]AAC63272.2 translation initiation factor 2 [Apis mellifera]|eukprot:NP_001011586.1 translation initiation factor 2 [Apis mellifera]